MGRAICSADRSQKLLLEQICSKCEGQNRKEGSNSSALARSGLRVCAFERSSKACLERGVRLGSQSKDGEGDFDLVSPRESLQKCERKQGLAKYKTIFCKVIWFAQQSTQVLCLKVVEGPLTKLLVLHSRSSRQQSSTSERKEPFGAFIGSTIALPLKLIRRR